MANLQAWLEEASKRAGLSSEEVANLNAVFGKNEKLANYVEESGLRQSDYDRKMNTLKAEHQARLEEIAEKERQADQFAARNGEWYNENNAKFQKTQKELEALRVKEATLVTKMKSVAERYGVPEEELEIPVSAAPVTPAAAVPAFDATKFMGRDEAMEFGRNLPIVTAELNEIAEDHRDLFGKALRNQKGIIEKALKVGKSIRQVWEEENGVAERRTKLAAEARQREIDEAVNAAVTKTRSELNLPAPRPEAERSPIVQRFAPAARTETKDPGRGLRAALSAYADRKYDSGNGGRAA